MLKYPPEIIYRLPVGGNTIRAIIVKFSTIKLRIKDFRL